MELVWLAASAITLALASLPISADRVPAAERAVFRAVNGAAELPMLLLWPIMQAGNVGVVLVVGIGAALLRRWRLLIATQIAGYGGYIAAKVVKRLVVRPRPSLLLAGVEIRGAEAVGRGFPAGHTAVIAAIAVAALPFVGPRSRALLIGLVVVVALLRIYVGAHLPLDVIGGAAVGSFAGALARLIVEGDR